MGGGPIPPIPHHASHLLITLPMNEPVSLLAALRNAHPTLHITYLNTRLTPRIPAPLYASCTILATLTLLPWDPVVECPHLKLVHLFTAETHFVRNSKLWNADGRDGRRLINVTNSRGAFSPQVAEWTSLTRLAHAHSYHLLQERQRRHEWSHSPATDDLAGQRVGILGYGSVGRHVARLAQGAGMEVIAYTARARRGRREKMDQVWSLNGLGDHEGEIPEEWWSSEDGEGKGGLHSFLGSGLDWLVIAVPLTPSTKRLLARDEFEILSRRPPFLTSVSHGAVIDQSALVNALAKGYIRGAALDLSDPASLPKESPLWEMKNVTVSSRVNISSKNTTVRSFQILSENAKRWSKGSSLFNLVERAKGY